MIAERLNRITQGLASYGQSVRERLNSNQQVLAGRLTTRLSGNIGDQIYDRLARLAIGIAPSHPLIAAVTRLKSQLDEALTTNAALEAQVEHLTRRAEEAERSGQTDALTQIFNRGYGDTTLTNEINRAVRYGHSLSLIIFDLDHFKFINDTYGHLAGDRVLQEVAKTINAVKRSSDIFFRYGGEEFGVVLPNAEILGAEKAAEKIRAAVEALQVEGIQARITISGGVTSFQNNDTRESFIGRADSALYWVKENGRNQIKTAEQKAA